MSLKKIIMLLVLLSGIVAVLYGCWFLEKNKVALSLGTYQNRKHYTMGEYQDMTSLTKYEYLEAQIEDNKYLKPMNEQDRNKMFEAIENFEMMINANDSSELSKYYDFDFECVDDNDYIYIDDECSIYKFNIYYFDSQTRTLYYFHHNI